MEFNFSAVIVRHVMEGEVGIYLTKKRPNMGRSVRGWQGGGVFHILVSKLFAVIVRHVEVIKNRKGG